MREILFRGKRVDNGEWETGSLLVERMNTSDQQVMIADKMTGYPTLVLPETVGQYTGLKGKNGLTKIFEGDVLINIYDIDKTYIVVFDDNEATFKMKYYKYYCEGKYECYEDMVLCTYCEVIGNIHDDPELLEVKEHER